MGWVLWFLFRKEAGVFSRRAGEVKRLVRTLHSQAGLAGTNWNVEMLGISEKMTILSSLATVFMAGTGYAETRDLTLVYPAKSELARPVQVEFALEGSVLHARFDIHTSEISAKEQLGPGEYPYQFDVVELFISVAGLQKPVGPFPYFEFELSPFDQTFTVRVESLKTPFHEGIDMGLRHAVAKTADGWSGEMWIPLSRLGWRGRPEKIVGNAYAILGPQGARSFWSLTLPPLKKPNFHQPQYFRRLI